MWFQNSNTPVIPQVWSPACDPLWLALWKGARRAIGHIMGDARLHRWWKMTDSPLRCHSCRAEALLVIRHLHSCKQHQYWSVQKLDLQENVLLAYLYLLQLWWTAMAFLGSHTVYSPSEPAPSLGRLPTATFSWLLSSLLLDFIPFCFRSFSQNTLSKPPSLPSFKATFCPLNSLSFSHPHHAHLLAFSIPGQNRCTVTFLSWANTTTKAT